MQLVLNTKSMIENQNGGKKNESIRYRICKEFYPHGKRWMGVGWHERNGGNLSYRIRLEEVEAVKEDFEPKEWQPIGTTVPKLAKEYFIVTGSGKYFRNVIIKPEDSICIIELDEKGKTTISVWGW